MIYDIYRKNIFKNFRYTLHITTNNLVTCRFTFVETMTMMTHEPMIEPRGMFSTAIGKNLQK